MPLIPTEQYRRNYAKIQWNHPLTEMPRRPTERASAAVISDTMDHTWHPLTGEYIDSKSRFRQITRENGGYEVGNDMGPARPQSHRPTRPGSDIKRAIEELRRG